jgi:DNA-binding beta-propeller fold protein YncE
VFDRAADGTLTQKAGTAGCISDSGSGGACADGTALEEATWVTVSPDGESAYVASGGSNAVAVFDRASDGTLTQKAGTAGCISNDGSGGACADGTALVFPDSVTVSPDGKSAYVASGGSGAVAVFDRGPAGTTSPPGGTIPPPGGPATSNPPPDGDGDGVPNATDGCPLTAGPANNSGCPANTFSFAGKPLRRNGYTILKVKVPGPGRITAAQAKVTKKKPALITAVAVSTKRAGQVTLKLKPTKAGKKMLAKRGKFTVKAKITYTPTGGKRSSRNQPVVLASGKFR